MPEVIRTANVQYDDMVGTVAMDEGDFEDYEKLLGLKDWVVLGVHVTAYHPSIGVQGKNAADESYSGFTVWGLARSELPDEGGLPALFAARHPIQVTEFELITSDSKYPAPVLDGIGLLMRGAKRLSINLWLKSVHDARLSVNDFDVIEQKQLKWDGSTWVEYEEPL